MDNNDNNDDTLYNNQLYVDRRRILDIICGAKSKSTKEEIIKLCVMIGFKLDMINDCFNAIA